MAIFPIAFMRRTRRRLYTTCFHEIGGLFQNKLELPLRDKLGHRLDLSFQFYEVPQIRELDQESGFVLQWLKSALYLPDLEFYSYINRVRL